MYSNTQNRSRERPNGLMLCTPWSLITTTSPGSTSRTKSAPTISSAQVSDASTQPPVPSGSRADAAEDQRAHAERVAHAHQRLGGQRHQRIGADHLLQRVDQPIDHGGVQADRDQVDEHLGVGGGLEQAAAPDQRPPQHVRVGQVAVMRHREAAELEIGVERLHVAQDGAAGRGVAVVADRRGAGQRGDHPRVAEIVADQAQAAMRMEVACRRS